MFGLVLIAWSAMGASLGSVLALCLFGYRPPQAAALAMMATAIAVVVVWQITDLDEQVLEIFPGMTAAFAVYGGWRGCRRLKRLGKSRS